MTRTPELVQFGDLTPAHFERHPVWISCHIADYDEPWYDQTDEETFRPWTEALPVDASYGMLLAKAEFLLADGTRLEGFMTPAVPGDPVELLGLMQPNVFLPTGTLGAFWEGGVTRDASEHAAFYRALGKTAAQVFPIRFSASEKLVTGITKGTLDGFYSIPDGEAVHVTT